MLRDIADRIDAEHERKVAETCSDALYHANEKDMAKLGWIRLPKDADGEPIRFGDKVTVSWGEKVYEVSGFSYTERLASGERTIWVDVYSPEKMRNIPLCGASSCHHYHAPTVEDVMVEFATDWESAQDGEDKVAVLKEYAKRLTLAEGEDA